MRLCRTTPLFRPQHHRGWTLCCAPWLRIVTTNTQHQTLLLHDQVRSGKCTTFIDALSFPEWSRAKVGEAGGRLHCVPWLGTQKWL